MTFPADPSRMPSRRLPLRRSPASTATAALTALATAGCLVLVAAAPAGAASRDRVARTAATTTTAAATATTTTTTTRRALPRWATPTRKAVRNTTTTTADPLVTEVVRLVNAERAKVGCVALRVDSRLATAARLHSEDMARQDYFDHTSLDGRTPWQRIEAQGYMDASGENIAAGYSTAAAVMVGWMNSPGHKANLLDCSHRATGVGVGKGGTYGTYWTQDFGRS